MGELIAAVLVDELFANGSAVPRLHLVESQPFRSGVVLLRCRTA